jgi:hypothetical protein
MTEVANRYLAAFKGAEEIPGGMSDQKALGQITLDGSIENFKRIDYLLDQIRERQAPKFDDFLKVHVNQNFLYLLVFYVGATVAANSGAQIEWLAYDEVIQKEPQLATIWPRQFKTSTICNLV